MTVYINAIFLFICVPLIYPSYDIYVHSFIVNYCSHVPTVSGLILSFSIKYDFVGHHVEIKYL